MTRLTPDLLAGKRLLVVEDDPRVLEAILELLADAGAEPALVDRRTNLPAARDFLQFVLDGEEPLDGIFTDWDLWGQTALPVVEWAQRQGVAVVICTGLPDEAARETNGCPVVSKMYLKEAILHLVEEIERMHSRERDD